MPQRLIPIQNVWISSVAALKASKRLTITSEEAVRFRRKYTGLSVLIRRLARRE
jgi:hypothetical protein